MRKGMLIEGMISITIIAILMLFLLKSSLIVMLLEIKNNNCTIPELPQMTEGKEYLDNLGGLDNLDNISELEQIKDKQKYYETLEKYSNFDIYEIIEEYSNFDIYEIIEENK